jgi:hypothetical protein
LQTRDTLEINRAIKVFQLNDYWSGLTPNDKLLGPLVHETIAAKLAVEDCESTYQLAPQPQSPATRPTAECTIDIPREGVTRALMSTRAEEAEFSFRLDSGSEDFRIHIDTVRSPALSKAKLTVRIIPLKNDLILDWNSVSPLFEKAFSNLPNGEFTFHLTRLKN